MASGDTITHGRGLPEDYAQYFFIEYWNFDKKKIILEKVVLYSKRINIAEWLFSLNFVKLSKLPKLVQYYYFKHSF